MDLTWSFSVLLRSAKEYNSTNDLMVHVDEDGRYSVGLEQGRHRDGRLADNRWSELRAHATCSAASRLAQWRIGYSSCGQRGDEMWYAITIREVVGSSDTCEASFCINPEAVNGDAEAEEHIRVFVNTFEHLTEGI